MPAEMMRFAGVDAVLLSSLGPGPVEPPRLEAREWDELWVRARTHGITPWLHRRWAECGRIGCLPQDIAARFAEARARNTERNRRIELQLRELCGLLEAAGIPTLVSKGIPLARLLYGDIGLRVLYDVDLLVRARDRGAALDRLSRAGYVSYFPDSGRAGRILLWRPKEYAWDAEGIFDPERPVLVELHTEPWETPWHGFRLPCPFEAVTSAARGPGPEGLPEEHLLVQLALHYACNALESTARLMHLLDVGLLLRKPGRSIDWDRVVACIEQGGLHRFCFLTLDLARRACGAKIPDPVDRILRARTPPAVLQWLEAEGLASAAAMSMYRPDRPTIYRLHWYMAETHGERARLLRFALQSAWNEASGLRRIPAFLRRNSARLRHLASATPLRK